MKYISFSSFEFVQDDFFKEWVNNPTQEHIIFWEEWLKKNPEKLPQVEEAKRIIKLIRFEQYKNPNAYLRSDWEEIQARIRIFETEKRTASRVKDYNPWSKIQRYSAAASVVLICVLFIFYFYSFYQPRTYKTGFGETKTIVLPDESKVTLNANSVLTLSGNWSEEATREVWLEGEGYFAVTHTKNHRKFIVNVDRLKVEVLGTEFNVSNRRNASKIVLNKGKVKVGMDGVREVVMHPGELVTYSNQDNKLVKKVVEPELFSSWKNNLLVFKDTPLTDVAEMLEDLYGLKIILSGKELSDKKFTGSIPSEDYEVLIQSIAEVFNLKVIREKKKIKFEINN